MGLRPAGILFALKGAVRMPDNYFPRQKWAKILVTGGYLILGAAGLYVVGLILPSAAPFLCAGALAWALSRPIRFVAKKTRIPRGIVAGVFCALAIGLLCVAVIFAGGELISGAGRLADYLDETAAGIGKKIASLCESLRTRFPALDRLGDGSLIEKGVDRMAGSLLSRASDFVTDVAASAVTAAPSALLFIVVTVVASFYFTCGYQGFVDFIRTRVFKSRWERVKRTADSVRGTLGAYVRTAVILSALSFVILGAGFAVMGIEKPVLTALICALVDVLPVFGVGTVLVPWSIIELAGGALSRGFGLAILYAVCCLVREILEPRLMSDAFGLHPAASLAAMYLGFRAAGFAGMIFLPIAAASAAAAMRNRRAVPAVDI